MVMLLMILLSGLTALAAPLLLQVWNHSGAELTIGRIGIIIAVILCSKCLRIILTTFRESFAEDFNKRNFMEMMDHFFHMNYDEILKHGATNLLEKIQMAVNSIYSYMTEGFIQIWAGFFMASLCLILMAGISIWLAVFMLLGLAINYIGFRLLNKKLTVLSQQLQINCSSGFQQILSQIQNADYIKQLSNYNMALHNLKPAADKIYGSMARINKFAQSMTIVLNGSTEIIQNLMMLFLVYAFAQNRISPYALLLATLVLPVYFSAVSSIVNAKINKRDYDVATAFQKEILDNAEEDGTEHLSQVNQMELSVQHLDVPGHRLDFSASGKLRKGDVVQICGSSGTGKSTFAKAILKFRHSEGISMNGVPIKEILNADLRRLTEYIPQNAPIVCGTLRDNLLLNTEPGRISDEQLLSNPFIKTILQHKTLDDLIQEGGTNLSGGEKQKLALARGLLENPDVLILDEICSNIDAEAANEIYAYLAESRKKRITLIISHDDLPSGLANKWINKEMV